MRSDNVYERVVKLWVSLWNLILEDKRHAETITAALQRLVFEKQGGYPRFKNWSEICKLGRIDHMLMMAVATVDMSREDDHVQQMISAFPQCFSESETHGPYPLSLLQARANEKKAAQGYKGLGAEFLVSYDAIPGDVPVQTFDKFGNRVAGCEGPVLPNGIDPDAPQGSVVIWEGKEFVVVENNIDCEELYIVPSECIRIDL